MSAGIITAKHAKIANKEGIVRYNFHRETREKREQKGSVPCSPGDRALVSGTIGRGFESRQARIFPPLKLSKSLPSATSFLPQGGPLFEPPTADMLVPVPFHKRIDCVMRSSPSLFLIMGLTGVFFF